MNQKPIGKRKQQARETRRKIVNCALRLFNEHGFENVSIEMISENAGVSVGAIYHHFKSKEEIAAQSLVVLDEDYEIFLNDLLTDPKYNTLSAFDKLKEFYIFVQVKSSELDSVNFAYSYDLKNRQASILLVSEERTLYRGWKKLIDMCREEGSISPELTDEELIRLLTYISRGLLVDWLLKEGKQDMKEQSRLVADHLLEGLRSRK